MYGWAAHYYDEDDIKDIKATPCNVVVNESVKVVPNATLEALKNKPKTKPIKKVEAANVLDLFSDL
ncbi:hypothetical protein JJC03_09295 [Flavobacterium oreochromis]|nr:hypothetical protein JJC03_09295 [Flavobacterium oreochromis]